METHCNVEFIKLCTNLDRLIIRRLLCFIHASLIINTCFCLSLAPACPVYFRNSWILTVLKFRFLSNWCHTIWNDFFTISTIMKICYQCLLCTHGYQTNKKKLSRKHKKQTKREDLLMTILTLQKWNNTHIFAQSTRRCQKSFLNERISTFCCLS